jgi:hypothetical protein
MKKVHCVMALRATLDCELSRINLAPVGRMARTGRPELGCSIKAAATTLCYNPDRTWGQARDMRRSPPHEIRARHTADAPSSPPGVLGRR